MRPLSFLLILSLSGGLLSCVGEKPVAQKGLDQAKKLKCRTNLSQLWMLRLTMPSREPDTGGEYWLQTKSTLPELYECPLEGTPNLGDTDYRGPVSPVGRSSRQEPVGACIGNHPDGSSFVLQKSGQVVEVRKGEPLYEEALEKTKR